VNDYDAINGTSNLKKYLTNLLPIVTTEEDILFMDRTLISEQTELTPPNRTL